MAAGSALFLCAFGLYLWCFQPAGSWGDGADFVLCSYFLGVPHPTGYPLYVILGKAATLVPLGSIGMANGLLASFSGAVAASLFFFAAARAARSAAAGFYAAAALAVTAFFWLQSITVEVYSLNLVFCVALILLLWKDDDVRPAIAFFAVAAFGLGNHGTLVVPAVILGLVLLARSIKRSGAAPALLTVGFFTIMGLSVFLCLPLLSAMSRVFNWNNPQLPQNMPQLLTGLDFWVIGEYIPAEMWKNFIRLACEINGQVSVAAAALFAAGALSTKSPLRNRFALFAVFAVAGAFPILYPTREKESFFLVSYALLLIFAAAGAGAPLSLAKSPSARRAAGAVLVAAAFVHAAFLLNRNKDNFTMRDNITPGIYSDALFSSARRDSLVFIDHLADDTIFPPMYSQFIDGRRPDVFLFYRLYLAFPWHLDAMRVRAAALGSQARVPGIDVAAEKEKMYQVAAEEKERREQGKTMNTIAIDLQTARLLDANRGVVPVYINTPQRFKRSLLSSNFRFAPSGALFALGADEGEKVPASMSAAARSTDKVFKAAGKELFTQRAALRSEQAMRFYQTDMSMYYAWLGKVVPDIQAALQFGEDCDLRDALTSVYARLGRDADAKNQSELAAQCKLKKLGEDAN